ncbi:MAG: hypothetical protein WCJ07_01335 [Verrucomicrobiota bacterium]
MAADVVTGRIVKVLPLLLDAQGRDATAPSLFERDAYQAYLREHTNQISAIRYAVQWNVSPSGAEKLRLRIELRGIGEGGVPKLKSLESEVTAGTFSQWTNLKLAGEDYKKIGSVAAWRVTLWAGEHQLGEQKSFLW